MKMKSRKLWAWIVWSIFAFSSLAITKVVDANIVSWYGLVTVTFIGSNVLQKYIFREK